MRSARWFGAILLLVGCGGSGNDGSGACTEGDEGCACYPNSTCNDGLTCASDLCVDLNGGVAPPPGDDTGSGSGGRSGDAGGGGASAPPTGGFVAPPPTEAAPTGDCSGGTSPTVTGNLRTSVANVPFDRVTVEVHHKRDIDVAEDGCLRELVFHLQYGDGCKLDITASDEIDLQGRMKISSAQFSADSQCPMFPDAQEGMYGGIQAFAFGGVTMEFDNIGDYNVEQSCIRNTFYLQPVGDMRDGSGRTLTVVPGSDLLVTGTFQSTSADGSCPVREQAPPPPPPPPPQSGSGGTGAGGIGGGAGTVAPAECPAPHTCVVNTTLSSAVYPHACSLSADGFPITCTTVDDCLSAGFTSGQVACIGKIVALPADYCFQPCTL